MAKIKKKTGNEGKYGHQKGRPHSANKKAKPTSAKRAVLNKDKLKNIQAKRKLESEKFAKRTRVDMKDPKNKALILKHFPKEMMTRRGVNVNIEGNVYNAKVVSKKGEMHIEHNAIHLKKDNLAAAITHPKKYLDRVDKRWLKSDGALYKKRIVAI